MFYSKPLQLQVYLSPVVFIILDVLIFSKLLAGSLFLACYFWYLQHVAMWHGITNQVGGDIISITIPVMFGRYVHCIKDLCTSENKLD